MAELDITNFVEFKKELKEFPYQLRKRVIKRGLTKGAGKLKTYLARAAPVDSGFLLHSLIVRRMRRIPKLYVKFEWHGGSGKYRNKQSYFGRLEWDYDGRHAFFHKTVKAHEKEIEQLIINGTMEALYEEAGKSYARTRRS